MGVLLEEVRREIHRLGRLIGATADEMPTFGVSREDGTPKIEVRDDGYHWVCRERGQEMRRRTFAERDDLLFCVFESITFQIASGQGRRRRIAGQDWRRETFRRQLELIGRLDPRWVPRLESHHREVLEHHPFVDEPVQEVAADATPGDGTPRRPWWRFW